MKAARWWIIETRLGAFALHGVEADAEVRVARFPRRLGRATHRPAMRRVPESGQPADQSLVLIAQRWAAQMALLAKRGA